MNILITVVVPVYNVEGYITECIQSIHNQTFTEFEAIIVNDGTQDNSIEVALACIADDSRFRIIHQNNQGLGATRNTGIENAKGEYICFIDSDDFIDKNYLKYMYDKLRITKGNICYCNIALYRRKTEVKYISLSFLADNPLASIRNILLGKPVSCCNALYHIKLFQALRFPNSIYEDTLTTMAIMLENTEKPISTVKQSLYYYRQRMGSITQQNNVKKYQEILENNIIKPKQFLIEKGLYAQLKPEFSIYVMLFFIIMIFQTAQFSIHFRQDYHDLKHCFLKNNFAKEVQIFPTLKYILLIKQHNIKACIKILLIPSLPHFGSVGQYMIKWIIRLRS